MTARIHPVPQERFSEWLETAIAEYARDLLATGLTVERARCEASTQLRGYFPQGGPSNGHAVFHVVDGEGTEVGYLWVGPDSSSDPGAWWIWDIFIIPAHRGFGFGRAAMELGEQYARSQGATTLGLNVFGSNKTAQALYFSLGFEVTHIKMRKQL